MNKKIESALKYAKDNQKQFLQELNELLTFESISTDPTFEPGIQAAAEWLAEKLKNIGMDKVAIMPTGGHPVVYGENLSAGKSAPTMLIYGHYDVQPADPLELWESGPFEPTERDGNLYARGASDMKGQVMATINAIDAVSKQGMLPLNVKYLIEGEEEHTSPNLEAFIKKHKELLACDFVLNPDAGMAAPDLPTITYGLRGICAFEINMQGPSQDLHSGMFGGAVRNPANELSRLIGGMHDENGRVTLPGFYDKVRELSDEERESLAQLPIDENTILKEVGAAEFWGEKGYSYIERTGSRPTLDVNGILSGYTGEGTKTVLPSKAMVKITTRLVPDQEPDEVHNQLVQYMEENAYPSVSWKVTYVDGSRPTISDRESASVKAMSKALETIWGRETVFFRSGGSVPAVGHLHDILGVEAVQTGFGRPDDNIHSPNEKLHLESWYKGIDTLIYFLHGLTE